MVLGETIGWPCCADLTPARRSRGRHERDVGLTYNLLGDPATRLSIEGLVGSPSATSTHAASNGPAVLPTAMPSATGHAPRPRHQGMIAIQQSERNGKVVAATLVRPDDEIMLITDKGVLVRTRVPEIRELGRATQGVTLIALDDGAKLSGLQRIVENDANVDSAGDTNGDAPGDEPTTGEDSEVCVP